MVRSRVGDELVNTALRARIRLDYRGVNKPGKFFFGGKSTEEVAEETREQQVNLLRNVPIQGTTIEEVDMSSDVYTVFDEMLNAQVAYAPVILTVKADSVEDIVRFIAREEFRKVEIIEPDNFVMSRNDIERLLFRVSEEYRSYKLLLERKFSAR